VSAANGRLKIFSTARFAQDAKYAKKNDFFVFRRRDAQVKKLHACRRQSSLSQEVRQAFLKAAFSLLSKNVVTTQQSRRKDL